MTTVERKRLNWLVAGGATIFIAWQCVVLAGDESVTHPTPNEIREGYVGTVFSRLPDRAFTYWMVNLENGGDPYGVCHIEDRGVEMLWLASTPRTSAEKPQPLFGVVDVVVLPKTYKADGLVVTMCTGGTRQRAVVALTTPDTRIERRAWAIDFTTAKFRELTPATGTCLPRMIREIE